jgi:hypothetical protein
MKSKILLFLVVVFLAGNWNGPTDISAKSYYSQLNKEQKDLYKIFLDHFCFQDEKAFTLELNQSFQGIPMESAVSTNRYNSLIAYSALFLDNPQLYWANEISLSYTGGNVFLDSILVSSRISDVKVKLSVNQAYYYEDLYEKQLTKAIKIIRKKIGKSKSKVKKLKVIHDYLCTNTKYSHKNATKSGSQYRYLHTAYGVFVKKKAVCDGYSMAMKELCDYFDIPCMVVYGRAKNPHGAYENHVWNVVKINKKWYAVDCTWDDSSKSKQWFLCGRKKLKTTHMELPKHADVLQEGVFSYPKITKKSYKK